MYLRTEPVVLDVSTSVHVGARWVFLRRLRPTSTGRPKIGAFNERTSQRTPARGLPDQETMSRMFLEYLTIYQAYTRVLPGRIRKGYYRAAWKYELQNRVSLRQLVYTL